MDQGCQRANDDGNDVDLMAGFDGQFEIELKLLKCEMNVVENGFQFFGFRIEFLFCICHLTRAIVYCFDCQRNLIETLAQLQWCRQTS